RPARRRHADHASRADEPRLRDLVGGRRLGPVDGHRTSVQRGSRAHGGAVSPHGARRESERPVMSYVISNATTADGRTTDITVEAGRIAETGDGPAGDPDVIDASGLIALPGLVDLHTHLREPGREDAETVLSGSKAAARGGFTAVHAMANTAPVADTAGVVEQIYRLGRSAGYTAVHPIGAVTVGLEGTRLAELGAMASSAARVRIFSDDGRCVSDPLLMRRALE